MSRSFLRTIGVALGATLLVLLVGAVGQFIPGWSRTVAVQAQPTVILRRVDPVAIATQIYTQYPGLPQENNYRQSGSNEVATTDTLISRFIRYHLYIKDRPANFRLDWKLSLADYLGAFEPINPDEYPSANSLTENPAAGDQAAIHRLSRTQRNQLVQSLFEIFTGYSASANSEAETTDTAPAATPNPSLTEPTPQPPSAADLL